MDTQNQKGQALIEMALVLAFFVVFWMFAQSSIQKQKKNFGKWKVGYETRTHLEKRHIKNSSK
jgi:hypothetical protein